jgi:hypothetical protein
MAKKRKAAVKGDGLGIASPLSCVTRPFLPETRPP